MSYLLGVPNGDYLPSSTDRNEWWLEWHYFLWDLGLSIQGGHPKGPIWKNHLWIASVPSKNHEGCTHAIVMENHRVVFDPSPRRRYPTSVSLLGKDIVIGGTWLEVADVEALDRLVDWRAKVNAVVLGGTVDPQ